MSVTSFKEIHRGRDGEERTDGHGANTVRYTRVFRVVTDSNDDSAKTIVDYGDCPKIGDSHPDDPTAFCQGVRPRNESFSKRVWLVTVLYSNQIELSVDPMADPVKYTWHTEQFQRPISIDKDGEAILNSAGDFFDPTIEAEESRWAITAVKNLPAVPSWILSYRNSINNAAITVDGILIPARCAKIQSMNISEPQDRNSTTFRIVTTTLLLKGQVTIGTTTYGGWVEQVLDQGWRELDGTGGARKNITNEDGTDITIPALLDGAGSKLANPSPSTAVYLPKYVYPETDFTKLPVF